MKNRYILKYGYGTSKGRDSYGYNIVRLKVDDIIASRTCGGGYDMRGTVLGDWIASEFKEELLKLDKKYYGLRFANPDWKPSQKTLEAEEKNGFIGLERYQDFNSRCSDVPTEKHIIPIIDGASGECSMRTIIEAIGYKYNHLSNNDFYEVVKN